MPNWDIFRWLRKPSRDLKVTILREKFSWPDASMDQCQALGCGIVRKDHGRMDHQFVEEA